MIRHGGCLYQFVRIVPSVTSPLGRTQKTHYEAVAQHSTTRRSLATSRVCNERSTSNGDADGAVSQGAAACQCPAGERGSVYGDRGIREHIPIDPEMPDLTDVKRMIYYENCLYQSVRIASDVTLVKLSRSYWRFESSWEHCSSRSRCGA